MTSHGFRKELLVRIWPSLGSEVLRFRRFQQPVSIDSGSLYELGTGWWNPSEGQRRRPCYMIHPVRGPGISTSLEFGSFEASFIRMDDSSKHSLI